MANKNQKKEDKEHIPTPFSRLDVYKELEAIKGRVSNVNHKHTVLC